MADPTTYHRIILKMQSPFPKRESDGQIWTCKFSLSGAAIPDAATAQETALDLWQPIQSLTGGDTNLAGWRYYPAGSSVNSFALDYAPGTHVGNQSGYTGAGSEVIDEQLEVIALGFCYVKQSSKGRPVYLTKHIHGVYGAATRGELAAVVGNPLAKWNTGCGPAELVPVDPTTGQSGTGWSLREALYTRQLRKGVKP